MKIEFGSELVYDDNDKYIITKIKIYAGSIITNFHSKNLPKEKEPCKFLLILMLDSALKAKKKYYPQILLEECKYKQRKLKMVNLVDDDLKQRLPDESGNESDTDSVMMIKIKMNITNNFLKDQKVF